MDLRFTGEELAFRDEVRAFIAAALPEAIQRKAALGHHFSKDDLVEWTRILNARGWGVPHWPVEWGGTGWSPVQQYLFQDELQQAGTPPLLAFGVNMVGPVIIAFGSDAQKRRFLPRIANLDDWWCQGFSEPGSGSDLASLRMTAKRDGASYVVNGQKTWTTLAQHADWIFCLVRTDPAAKKQEGISFLLIDMKSPGVAVRPIQTIDGGFEINEVFFDDVRVPVDNLVGQENKGWDYAKFLLGNERATIARVGQSKEWIRRIRRLAAQAPDGERTLIENRRFREKLTAVEVELKALEVTQLRVVAAERAREHGKPDPASSILKLKGSEIQQATAELLLEVAGPYALPFQPEPTEGWNEPPIGPEWAGSIAPTYFNYRKVSIYGGSNEIEKNIIAKAILACEMDFDLDEEQALLRDSVERLMAGRYGFEQRQAYARADDGWSRALWGQYAELGLLGLAFEEAHGGSARGPIETMIVMEAFGRALALEPYLATVVIGGGLLRHGGTAAQKAALLPRIADGTLLVALAHGERQSRYDLADVATMARRDGTDWILDGEKGLVLHGDSADQLLVTARTAGDRRERRGIGLFIVDAKATGAARRGYPTQDGLRAAELSLAGVRVARDGVIGDPEDALPLIERVVDEAMAALAAEAVGAMLGMHELTVEYLKTRKQFGTTIGSFQALQHRAADMFVAVEQARSMAMLATMMLQTDDVAERRRNVAAAKIQIGRSGRFVGQQAIQLHGGVGMTMEYKVGHYFKRVAMIDTLFGDADHHLDRLAEAGGLPLD